MYEMEEKMIEVRDDVVAADISSLTVSPIDNKNEMFDEKNSSNGQTSMKNEHHDLKTTDIANVPKEVRVYSNLDLNEYKDYETPLEKNSVENAGTYQPSPNSLNKSSGENTTETENAITVDKKIQNDSIPPIVVDSNTSSLDSASQPKNYKSVILEDWDIDIPPSSAASDLSTQSLHITESIESVMRKNENTNANQDSNIGYNFGGHDEDNYNDRESGINNDLNNVNKNNGGNDRNTTSTITRTTTNIITTTTAAAATAALTTTTTTTTTNNNNNNNNNNNSSNNKSNNNNNNGNDTNINNDNDKISSGNYGNNNIIESGTEVVTRNENSRNNLTICETGNEEKLIETTTNATNFKSEIVEKKFNDLKDDLIKPVLDKKKNPLKYSNLIVSNQDIVEILENSVERVGRPIMPAKDIFLSIELRKHLNQKLNTSVKQSGAELNKTLISDSQSSLNKIASRAKEMKTVQKAKDVAGQTGNTSGKTITSQKIGEQQIIATDQNKSIKKRTPRKKLPICEEMERTIALKQLRDEFPVTRKKFKTTKQVNHIPFLASSVLEKLTNTASSPELPSSQRRRPCYLPENNSVESEAIDNRSKSPVLNAREDKKDVGETASENTTRPIIPSNGKNSNPSSSIVRTYCAKRKSTESENDIKTVLETFVSASRDMQQEEEEKNNDLKPKKQKTVPNDSDVETTKKINKPCPKKGKSDSGTVKKRNLELEKLLGDEGAVRMLYDTQHRDESVKPSNRKSRLKTTLGLKKDLIMKTKLVKNAVLRLSGVGSDGVSLRGKRRSLKSNSDAVVESDSLFITSTPNVILYKPKKKQRAEASRILYRHSSSESFESLEGSRTFEGDLMNSTNNRESILVNGDLFKDKITNETGDIESFCGSNKKMKSPQKNKLVGANKGKKLKARKERELKLEKERKSKDNVDSQSVTNSSQQKLVLSNVPVRKSNRPRMVSKKYSIWSSTTMDSLSVESLGFKKPKKASQDLARKLNFKELRVLQHGSLVQIILASSSTVLKSSFNEQVFTELKDAFDFLSYEESCSAILITSSGATFCQGIDLNYVLSVEEEDRKQCYGNLLNCLKQFIIRLTNFTKPVIAGVQAGAIGLGVTLLAFCDVVVASDRASFYTPYARIGQMSEGAATITFPQISKQLVTELLIKSEKITASEALKYGLVSQVVAEDRFEEELMLLSKRIASYSVQAIQSMKILANKTHYQKIAETLEIENQLILDHWCSNECINNIIKFLNSGEVQFRHLDVT